MRSWDEMALEIAETKRTLTDATDRLNAAANQTHSVATSTDKATDGFHDAANYAEQAKNSMNVVAEAANGAAAEADYEARMLAGTTLSVSEIGEPGVTLTRREDGQELTFTIPHATPGEKGPQGDAAHDGVDFRYDASTETLYIDYGDVT